MQINLILLTKIIASVIRVLGRKIAKSPAFREFNGFAYTIRLLITQLLSSATRIHLFEVNFLHFISSHLTLYTARQAGKQASS